MSDPGALTTTPHIVALDSPRALLRFFAGLHDNPQQTLRALTTGGGHPYTRLEYGTGRAHLVADPALAAALLRDNRLFQKPDSFRAVLNFFGGEGIFASAFDRWKGQRSVISPYFNAESVHDRFEESCALIDETLLDLKEGRDVIPYDFCRLFSLRIFCRTVLGDDPGPDKCRAISQAMDAANERMSAVLTDARYHLDGTLPPPAPDLPRAVLPLLRYIGTLAEARLALDDEQQPADILGTIIGRLRAETTDEGAVRKQLREEIYHLMLGGHETTGTAVAWALYNLAHQPAMQDCLRAEIDRCAPGGRAAGPEVFKDMPYLKQVKQETLRRHPSPFISFPREAVADAPPEAYDGLDIRSGDKLFILIDAIHRDPRWYETPADFNPDHFNAAAVKDRPKAAFIPFLAGPHVCPGRLMFSQVADSALTAIFERYAVAPAADHPAFPAATRSISGAPEPVPLTLTARTPAWIRP